MAPLTLTILAETFTIHRFHPQEQIPVAAFEASFLSITRTPAELSVVVGEEIDLQSDQKETGWGGFMVKGPLDFALTGILAEISGLLADAKISIFALSTFDTDYILVKREKVSTAKQIFIKNGYEVLGP